jgi:putative mRNA 3-end processing factor
MATIEGSGAEEVWVTHGYAATVVRYLTERGLKSKVLPTRFVGEEAEPQEAPADEPVPEEAAGE